MPGLRILLRLAPFFVGALAAAVWLRRRRIERTPLPPPPARPALAPAPDPAVVPAEPPPAAEPEATGREPISIITVVDDLLQIGH